MSSFCSYFCSYVFEVSLNRHFYSLKLIENACFKEGVDFVVQTVACSECLISLAQPAQKQNILQILYRSLCMCYNSATTYYRNQWYYYASFKASMHHFPNPFQGQSEVELWVSPFGGALGYWLPFWTTKSTPSLKQAFSINFKE